MLKLKKIIKEIWRYPLCLYMRTKLKNQTFSIISSNCIGGILSHDLGQQFRSPTINLTVDNFSLFIKDLKSYLDMPLEDAGTNNRNEPVGKLGSVVITGVHYKDFQSLKNAWERRCMRINFDNIYIIATDLELKPFEYSCFDKLPYPKVCFTSQKKPDYEWMCFCPEFAGRPHVGDTLRYTNILGVRIFEKNFNCVQWLNKK